MKSQEKLLFLAFNVECVCVDLSTCAAIVLSLPKQATTAAIH